MLLVSSMDTHSPTKREIKHGMKWQSTAKCQKKTRLNGVVPETQIQHNPKQLCKCTVTAEETEQFC